MVEQAQLVAAEVVLDVRVVVLLRGFVMRTQGLKLRAKSPRVSWKSANTRFQLRDSGSARPFDWWTKPALTERSFRPSSS